VSKETVSVPDIGGADAAEVVELLVAVGDEVAVDQGLVVLESDKASLEIPSTVAGKVLELLVGEGDQLKEGDPVAVIENAEAGAKETPESNQGAPEPEQPAATGAAKASQSKAPEADVPSGEGGSGTDANADTDAVEADAGGSGKERTETVVVPDIGTEDAVDVVEVMVQVGDTVSEGDSLIVLESDKASMEVPSTVNGVISALHAKEGKPLKQGDAVAEITVQGAVEKAAPTSPETADAKADVGVKGEVQASQADDPETEQAASGRRSESEATAPATAGAGGKSADSGVYAGPAVRRLAREFGVVLADVRGSGPRGRIVKEDLQQYVQRALREPPASSGTGAVPPVPEVDFAEFGEVEVVKRSRIDRVTADNMRRSWLNVPHVTQFDDADITEMERFRKSLKAEGERRGVKLTPLPFLLKACAAALKNNDKLNASLSGGGETLTYKRYVHIGMAVDTPAGLVVPVIRDVDQKGLWELAEEVLALAEKARDRKLRPAEMQGGGFTISSLGAIGGRGFTPIVNTPEVAILGVSRAQTQPVWDGAAFQPRLQLPLALSYDHRVVNGGDGGRFLTELKSLLEDVRRLLL
jgi:pyruvate dehydrogenase E2 component (dihydrolipoamide acetyltransferase)